MMQQDRIGAFETLYTTIYSLCIYTGRWIAPSLQHKGDAQLNALDRGRFLSQIGRHKCFSSRNDVMP